MADGIGKGGLPPFPGPAQCRSGGSVGANCIHPRHSQNVPAWQARPCVWLSPLRRVVVLALIIVLAGGCGSDLPTASNPSCSWASDPPSNAASVCTKTFATLSAVTAATVRADTGTVRRLVPNQAVAGRIIAYGRKLRSEGNATSVHPVPSLVLNVTSLGIGALVYLSGLAGSTKVKDEETVYLDTTHSQAVITGDTQGQDW
jgi:hypothetical protein